MLKLEVFEIDTPAPTDGSAQTVVLDQLALEEAKLEAYDKGYQAGWDDAAASQQEEKGRISAEFARNLQGLSFTYNEARGALLKALRPLVTGITGRLLPELARETLGPVVLDVLMPMAEKLADAPVTIVLNPAMRETVEGLVASATGMPVLIEEEPSLGEGQVFLRIGGQEASVDLDGAIAEIQAAVRGFFDLSEKE